MRRDYINNALQILNTIGLSPPVLDFNLRRVNTLKNTRVSVSLGDLNLTDSDIIEDSRHYLPSCAHAARRIDDPQLGQSPPVIQRYLAQYLLQGRYRQISQTDLLQVVYQRPTLDLPRQEQLSDYLLLKIDDRLHVGVDVLYVYLLYPKHEDGTELSVQTAGVVKT
jgi:hypothetical protein